MSKLLLAALNEGVSHSMSGNHEAAIQAFDRVLSQDAHHALALSSKGFSLASLGRPSDALRCFEHALALDPLNADHHRQAALCLLALNEPEAARSLLERALQLNTEQAYREATAMEIHNLGQAVLRGPVKQRARREGLAGKARYRQARHLLEMALELDPGLVEAARCLADVWARLGDKARRDQYLQLAHRLGRMAAG